MALPHFLCIGAQKAGTSWLNEQLKTHPEVWMPPIKELHFFDYLYTEDTKSWGQWHLENHSAKLIRWHINHIDPPNLPYVRYLSELATQDTFSERWYRAAFDWVAAAGKVLGDVTPEYSTIGADGIAYVKRLLPDARVIYIIRDPVSRAMSQLRMNVSRAGHQMDDQRWEAAVNDPALMDRGRYSSYIPAWQQAFGDNLMLIPYRRLRNDPVQLLREIGAFIGVPDHSYESPHSEIHVTDRIDVPADVAGQLQATMERERAFLRQHLGEQFCGMI